MTPLNEFGADAHSALSEIIPLLNDTNLDVRAMAARTLACIRRASGKTGDDIPTNVLARLASLAHGDDLTTQWAIDALSIMGTNGAKALTKISQAADNSHRREAALVLRKMGKAVQAR